MLSDIFVIDSASLYPLDELVINKDFEKNPEEFEETYVYFPVTAPFSPLSDSPNARYGLAIKKGEVPPSFSDESKIVAMAIDELQLQAKEAWWGITKNIYPLSLTSNGCKVLWEVVDDSAWKGSVDQLSTYEPIKLAITAAGYSGSPELPLIKQVPVLDQSTTNATKSAAKIVLTSGFALGEGETFYYGISSDPVNRINDGASIKVMFQDKNAAGANYEYGVQDYPYTTRVEAASFADGMELNLVDAAPDKYLMLYSVEETPEDFFYIRGFASAPLKIDNQSVNYLLRYPCEINTSITKGMGVLISEATKTVDYEGSFTVAVAPETGWVVESITVNGVAQVVAKVTVNGTQYDGIALTDIISDSRIEVSFAETVA
jgi:hypothetical protein